MKIATIVGARPQFIKAGPVSQAITVYNRSTVSTYQIEEILIHTGQHYDHEMSGVFFETLGLKSPKYNLGAGSGSHGVQLAKMLRGLEKVLLQERPSLVLVYGDTNSTLAGALIADRMNLPLAHVEAGLRSFNRRMPEEANRIIADHLSCLLFVPTDTAVNNLAREGIIEGVHKVGDVMHEAAMRNIKIAMAESTVLERFNLRAQDFSLATVHRAENVDDLSRLQGIFEGLADASMRQTIVWPVHPRTRKQLLALKTAGLPPDRLLLTDPLPYRDMLVLENAAAVVLTDSGGVQKEATWFGLPCVTLRDETEWVETLSSGRNELAGFRRDRIKVAFETALLKPRGPMSVLNNEPLPSEQIVRHLCAFAGCGRVLTGAHA